MALDHDVSEKTKAAIESAIQRLIELGADTESATMLLAFQCSLRLRKPSNIREVRGALNSAAVLAEPDQNKTPLESEESVEYLAIPPIHYSIEQMQGSGLRAEAIGHALIGQGVMHLADNLDPASMLDHLSMAQEEIAKRLDDIKRGAN